MRVAVSKLPDAACTRWGLAFNVGAPLFVAIRAALPGVASPAALAAAAGCAAGLGHALARNPVLVAMLFGLLIGNQPCIA
jgi:hypothetical protein